MRLAVVLCVLAACQGGEDTTKKKKTDLPTTSVEQVKPPIDIKTPPKDAVKTSSGVRYKKLKENPSGDAPARNDTVLLNYTGWKHATGETFFTNRSQGQPTVLALSTTTASFIEAVSVIRKGERVILWLPPEMSKAPGSAAGEELVYEIELVDIVRAPALPPDYNAPPANALALPSGAKYLVVKQSGDTEKARAYDNVTFDYTAWDKDGRMFDSTEMRKRPATVPPFRQSAVMEQVLTLAAKGDRIRFWADGNQLSVGGKASGLPQGLLCYEVQVTAIERAAADPPPVPADVAAPPADAKKSPGGVAYKILKAGKGKKPTKDNTVKVNYTGWTVDGRMFDSTVIKKEPTELALPSAIKGWVDVMPLMHEGDVARLWVPEELAYKDQPGRPQGMLVYDVEILEVKPTKLLDNQPGGTKAPVTPPDVAGPPKDAKKSPKGVFYKILAHGKKGAAHPKATDTVKVEYAGWSTDGKLFDSSAQKGPMDIELKASIPGWEDAIPLMAVGDKMRMWVPEALAYQGLDDGPKGMLVFDVELLEIK